MKDDDSYSEGNSESYDSGDGSQNDDSHSHSGGSQYSLEQHSVDSRGRPYSSSREQRHVDGGDDDNGDDYSGEYSDGGSRSERSGSSRSGSRSPDSGSYPKDEDGIRSLDSKGMPYDDDDDDDVSYDSRGEPYSDDEYYSDEEWGDGAIKKQPQDDEGSYTGSYSGDDRSYDSRDRDDRSYDSRHQDDGGSYASGDDRSYQSPVPGENVDASPRSYDSRDRDHSGSNDSRERDHSGSYDSRNQDHSGSYDSRGGSRGSYDSQDRDHSGSYDSRDRDPSGRSYDSRSRDGDDRSHDSREQGDDRSYDSGGRSQDSRSFDSRERGNDFPDDEFNHSRRSSDSRGSNSYDSRNSGLEKSYRSRDFSDEDRSYDSKQDHSGSKDSLHSITDDETPSDSRRASELEESVTKTDEDYTSETSGDDPVARVYSGMVSGATLYSGIPSTTDSLNEPSEVSCSTFAADSSDGFETSFETSFETDTNDSSTKASVGSFASPAKSEGSQGQSRALPYHQNNMLANGDTSSSAGSQSFATDDDQDQPEEEHSLSLDDLQEVTESEYESESGSRTESNYESQTGSHTEGSYYESQTGSHTERSNYESQTGSNYESQTGSHSGSQSGSHYDSQSGSQFSGSYRSQEDNQEGNGFHDSAGARSEQTGSDYSGTSFASGNDSRSQSMGEEAEKSNGDSFGNSFDHSESSGFGNGDGQDFGGQSSIAGSILSRDQPLLKITEHSVEQSASEDGSPRQHSADFGASMLGDEEADESASSRDTLSDESNSQNDESTGSDDEPIYTPSSTPIVAQPQSPTVVSDDEGDESSRVARTYNGYTREQMARLMNDPPPEDLGDGRDIPDRSKTGKKKPWQRINCKSDELLDLVANVNDAMSDVEKEEDANGGEVDVDSAPRLLLLGFESLVGVLLQMSDELELMSTFAKLKEDAAKEAIRSLLAFAPVLDDIFADMKPILLHFLEEEIDEEVADYFYGMNCVVDLICEVVHRVGEKQEWNARSNTSLVTLLEILSRDLLEVESIFNDVDTPRYEVSGLLKEAWGTTGHEEEAKTLDVTGDLTLFRQLCYEVMLSTDQWCPDTTTLMDICGVDQNMLDEQVLDANDEEDNELAPTPEAALRVLERISGDPLPRSDTVVSVIRRILPIAAIADHILVDKFASIRSNIRDPLGLSTSSLVSISSVPEVLNDPDAYGLSGVGKTTIAAMVANHNDVRRYFRDGVVWIHIGPKELDYARYVQCMKDLVSQLLLYDDEEDEEPLFPELLHTPGESKAKRRRREEGFMMYVRETMLDFLRFRNVLIILEDVCFEPDLDWFDFAPVTVEEEENFACVVLVTSRCRNLLPAADTVEVDMLDEAEAVSLLIQESGKLPHDMMAGSPETRAVVRECANHPLAVKSVGRWLNLKHATAGAVSSVEEIHEDVIKSMEKVLKSGGQQGQEGDMMYEILNMSLTPSMNGEPTDIIKFCLAAFVVVFCDRKHLSDFSLVESTPLVPLDIAKILIESLLNLEEETLLKEGSLFYAQKQEATDLIPKALAALGILNEITTFAEFPEDGSQDGKEVEQKYLQIMHHIQQEYGEYLFSEDLSLHELTVDAERKWNRALCQSYLAQDINWDSDLPDAALDYALEQIPSHMIRGGLLAEASALLSNPSFVQGRLFSLGRENACMRQIMDAEFLFDVLSDQSASSRKKLEPKHVIKQAYSTMGGLLNMDEDEFIAEEGSPEALEVARSHFQLGFSLAEKRCWEPALSHWETSQELVVEAVGMVEFVAGILYCVGVVYSEMNEYDQALASLKQCLKIRGTIHGEEHILYAQTIQKIGDIFLAMSDYHEANESYNWALDVMHIEPSHHRIDIGDILENIGNIHFSKGELEEAIQSYQDGLRSKQVDLGENHPELSTMYHHIGECLSDQGNNERKNEGKNEEAIAHLEVAIRLKEGDPEGDGERDADVLTIKGVLCNLRGKQQEGLEFYEKALQVLVTKVPHKKEKVASLLHLIGCVYLMNGEQKKAMKLFEESLQARRKILGFVHLDVAATLFNMAYLHQSRKRLDKALKCLEEALKIRQLRLPDSEKVALTHERIGTLARTVGKSKKAENAFNDALRIRKVIHGESHEAVATVLQELGDLMDDLGEYEEAMNYYNEALEIRHQRLGPDDLAVAETLYSMGYTLQNKEASDRALSCFEESLNIRTFQLGEDAKEVGDTLNMMGFLQVNRGELDEALSLLWDALRIRKLQKDNVKVSETLKNIGNVHRQKEEFELAIECYEECLRIRRVELGHEHEKVADALIAIGNVYSDMDSAEDAKDCYKEALTIRTQCFGESDESVAAVLQYMGTLEFRGGELDTALQLFTEFIRIRNGNNTEKDGDYVNVLFMMGNIHKMQHNEDDAQTCWTEAYEVFQALGLAKDNPEIAQVMGNLVNEGDEDAMPEQARDSKNVRRMLGKLSEKVKGTFNENKGRSKNRGHQL